MEERELPYKPKWGRPRAAKTSPKYRISVLQIQKHRPATSREWLCRRVTVLLRAVIPLVLWIGWRNWICLLADWCKSQNCSGFLYYLSTTTPWCPLYQPSKADEKWGWDPNQGQPLKAGQKLIRLSQTEKMATDWSETSLSPTEVCEWGRKRKKTRKLVMVKEGDEERKQARRSSKLRATSKKSYQ